MDSMLTDNSLCRWMFEIANICNWSQHIHDMPGGPCQRSISQTWNGIILSGSTSNYKEWKPFLIGGEIGWNRAFHVPPIMSIHHLSTKSKVQNCKWRVLIIYREIKQSVQSGNSWGRQWCKYKKEELILQLTSSQLINNEKKNLYNLLYI